MQGGFVEVSLLIARRSLTAFVSVLGLGVLVAGCGGGSGTTLPQASIAAPYYQGNVVESCGGPVPTGYARCFALQRTDVGGAVDLTGTGATKGLMSAPNGKPGGGGGTPSGYGPSQLRSAYNLPSTTAGSGQTVAIVDAYDDPNAENDMNVYRSTFGIASCTTSNGCFKKVNQNGVQGSYPTGNSSWGQEISLDLDMVSAICPNCHIILVEASSASTANLDTSVNTAASLGANEISNSYGGSEASGYDAAYDHPGIMITASAGDSGTGAAQPASFGTVTAVGGTTLTTASTSRGWAETVWSGSGSGCSKYVAKPGWQSGAVFACPNRTNNDVASDADPNTGVSVYDSYGSRHSTGWLVFGGTSVSSPTIASVYALAGNGASLTYGSYSYTHTSSLNDVTSGSNGTCSYFYVCNAEVGYDGPTGNGTPNGIGAF